jgi:hypothetical protein
MNSRERNLHGAAQVGELVVAVFQGLASICQCVVISISISAVAGLEQCEYGRTYILTRQRQQRAARRRSLVGPRR